MTYIDMKQLIEILQTKKQWTFDSLLEHLSALKTHFNIDYNVDNLRVMFTELMK